MNKPAHLAKAYAEQFEDKSIVENYKYRPAYSQKIIATLCEIINKPNSRVLDIGCGSGEISIPLAERGYKVDAIDPSFEMIEAGKNKSDAVRWHNINAEEFEYEEASYDLICGANSLHWTDWPVAFPKFKQVLKENCHVAIITGGELIHLDIQQDIVELIIKYSTNTDFVPFALVELLEQGNHFKPVSSVTTDAEIFTQEPAEFIASFHARNGFSIERMAEGKANEFDEALYLLIEPHLKNGLVEGTVQSTITWGNPI